MRLIIYNICWSVPQIPMFSYNMTLWIQNIFTVRLASLANKCQIGLIAIIMNELTLSNESILLLKMDQFVMKNLLTKDADSNQTQDV